MKSLYSDVRNVLRRLPESSFSRISNASTGKWADLVRETTVPVWEELPSCLGLAAVVYLELPVSDQQLSDSMADLGYGGILILDQPVASRSQAFLKGWDALASRLERLGELVGRDFVDDRLTVVVVKLWSTDTVSAAE